MWAEILSKLKNMNEFHLPDADRAFRQKHLDQSLTLSVNDRAHVYI